MAGETQGIVCWSIGIASMLFLCHEPLMRILIYFIMNIVINHYYFVLLRRNSETMKRSVLICISVVCAVFLVSCHKDCVCKYYHNDKFYDVKVWDDKNVTDEDCRSMNDTYELNVPIGETAEFELVNVKVVCTRGKSE